MTNDNTIEPDAALKIEDPSKTDHGKQPKRALFYHYYEAQQDYRDNLIFFLDQAYSEEIDFYFMFAGETTLELPKRDNIHTLQIENINLDYGGYAAVIRQLGDNLKQYDYFYFVNNSVRGPFLPAYGRPDNWYDLLEAQLSDEVHLAGVSVNDLLPNAAQHQQFIDMYGSEFEPPYSHIQTTAYVMTKTGLEHLISCGFYDIDYVMSKREVILKYEVLLSQLMKKKGWNIACLLPGYQNIDYRVEQSQLNPTLGGGNPIKPNNYFGRSVLPEETIFIKSNKGLMTKSVMASHTLSALTLYRSKYFKDWAPLNELIKRSTTCIEQHFETFLASDRPTLWYQFKCLIVTLLRKVKSPKRANKPRKAFN